VGSLESTETGDFTCRGNGYLRIRIKEFVRENGGVEGTQTRCQGSKCASMSTTRTVRNGYWNFGGVMGDGAGERMMTCEMCTENDKGGEWLEKAVAVKVVEVQNMARQIL
jgi:hypothetical protein